MEKNLKIWRKKYRRKITGRWQKNGQGSEKN